MRAVRDTPSEFGSTGLREGYGRFVLAGFPRRERDVKQRLAGSWVTLVFCPGEGRALLGSRFNAALHT